MFLLRFFSAEDRGAYVICSLFGYLLFLASRPAIWAPYAALLLTYHLFLAYRVYVLKSGAARTHGLPATVAAHLGFVVLVVALRLGLVTYIRSDLQSLPKESLAAAASLGAWVLRVVMILATYGLATLERRLFFSGEQEKKTDNPADIESILVEMRSKYPQDASTLIAATGSDHAEWTQYCARRKSTFYDPRKSPKEDFEQWLRARGKTQYPVTQNQPSTASN